MSPPPVPPEPLPPQTARLFDQPPDGIADFSESLDPIPFRINNDVFLAAPQLPPAQALRFAATARQLQTTLQQDPEGVIRLFEDIFCGTPPDAAGHGHPGILLPPTDQRFRDRLDSVAEPISLTQLPRIINWLLERYGLRPTPPSSGSSNGSASPASGTSSTADSASPAATPSDSPSPGSSTPSTPTASPASTEPTGTSSTPS